LKGLVVEAFGGPLVLQDVAKGEPSPGEVVGKVLACGVGLTTRNCLRGDLGSDPKLLPFIPGDELVGVVEQCGLGVNEKLIGKLVTAYF